MKAALVTLQKKLKGYDAQTAELLQLQDDLHSKVFSKPYSCSDYLGKHPHTLYTVSTGSGQGS